MNVTIRLSKPADAAKMAEIHARSWEAAYAEIIPTELIKEKNATRLALYQRIITEENSTHYLIESDGRAVGIMGIAPPQDDDVDDRFYELHGIYLDPDYFRRGIGTQAVDFAFNKARSLGKKLMNVWVFAENSNTIRFYEKCGFAAENKTKIYDCGKLMECFRMKKEL